jgi:hypothetical protein
VLERHHVDIHQGVPTRVPRRAIGLEMREAGAWRQDLMKTLEALKG